MTADIAKQRYTSSYDWIGGSDDNAYTSTRATEWNKWHGGDGDDYLKSSSDSHIYNSGNARDIIVGGNGNDTIIGGLGGDTLRGNAGNDFIMGRAGADWIEGGSGIDIAVYYYSFYRVTVHLDGKLGSGGSAEGDVLQGIENLLGSAFDDSLHGHHLDNHIYGGRGNDMLYGYAGADTLEGGSGDDTLFGGSRK